MVGTTVGMVGMGDTVITAVGTTSTTVTMAITVAASGVRSSWVA